MEKYKQMKNSIYKRTYGWGYAAGLMLLSSAVISAVLYLVLIFSSGFPHISELLLSIVVAPAFAIPVAICRILLYYVGKILSIFGRLGKIIGYPVIILAFVTFLGNVLVGSADGGILSSNLLTTVIAVVVDVAVIVGSIFLLKTKKEPADTTETQEFAVESKEEN